MKEYYTLGQIVKVESSDGNYPCLQAFFGSQVCVSHNYRTKAELIRRGYLKQNAFPITADLKIIGYGLHPHVAMILYILQDTKQQNDFYLYNLDGYSEYVKVVRQ